MPVKKPLKTVRAAASGVARRATRKASGGRAPAIIIPADQLDNIGQTRLTEEQFVKILQALETHPRRLKKLMAPLHPADIADILERLPRQRRADLLPHIPFDSMGEVIAELEPGVQENILQLLKPEQVKEALSDLDSNDAAELARVVEEMGTQEGQDAEDLLADHQQKRLLHYDADTAGGLMQLEVVTTLPDNSVGDMMAYLRDNEDKLPEKPGTIFVTNENRKLLGTISLSRLVQMPLAASLEDVMRKNPLTVTPEVKENEVISLFEKYDIHNLAVVNSRGQLLGRITIDDVLDVVMEQASRQQARAAGLSEGEDLFAPVLETARHRMPWLLINLLTAVAAAAVIALFEDSIAKLVTLAILMPIVASMGGNATTQTQTVIIRALALGQITRQNAKDLLWREFKAGGYLGTILALLMALGVWLLYGSPMLALVIALATVANHLFAAAAGFATPIVVRRMGYDPAVATGVITTTVTDVGGFFVFLGLATIMLL